MGTGMEKECECCSHVLRMRFWPLDMQLDTTRRPEPETEPEPQPEPQHLRLSGSTASRAGFVLGTLQLFRSSFSCAVALHEATLWREASSSSNNCNTFTLCGWGDSAMMYGLNLRCLCLYLWQSHCHSPCPCHNRCHCPKLDCCLLL